MDSTEMDAILDELAAGRIDKAEAARRIQAVRGAGSNAPQQAADGLGWPAAESPADQPLSAAAEEAVVEEQAVEEPEPAPAAEPLNERDLGRAQAPGVAREDFRRPVHGPEPTAGTDTSDASTTDPSDTGTDPSGTDPGERGSAASDGSKAGRTGQDAPKAEDKVSTADGVPDLGAWFDTARRGFGRLRSDAEKGFDRLRAEAESRLGERRPSADSGAGAGTGTPKNSAKGVQRVFIRAVGRRIRVVGDADVATVTVDGTHNLKRRDQVIEITSEGDVGPSLQGFSIFRPPRSFDDVKSMGLGRELTVRINPALQLDAEITGGSLHTEGVERLGKVRVTVGGARFSGVTGAEDVLVQAGPATLAATITSGRSRVRCESGTLTVTLGAGSNVTVHTESQLGRIAWAGAHSGAADEVELGNGSARLDVGAVMASATIRTEVAE
ncbi:hypothetical protein ACF3NT_00630 [Naumannella halotolerans]|uniref:hypothetical protein n=1 Tax=Naumannella halotolerans TaxID=993414 RepID=UPI00370DC156